MYATCYVEYEQHLILEVMLIQDSNPLPIRQLNRAILMARKSATVESLVLRMGLSIEQVNPSFLVE